MSSNISTQPHPKQPNPLQSINLRRTVINVILTAYLLPTALLFVSAGTLDWWQGWGFVLVFAGMGLGSRLLLILMRPDLVVERVSFKRHENTQPWDKILMPLVLLTPLITLIVAGLDKRNGWSSEISQGIEIAALVVIALNMLLAHWAMMANRFFSSIVRIQHDRGHQVVDNGPYRFVRHPGYSSAVFVNLATPLILGSLWAIIPAIVAVAILVIRTRLEDQVLQREIEGYADYAKRVRYRLIPGIW